MYRERRNAGQKRERTSDLLIRSNIRSRISLGDDHILERRHVLQPSRKLDAFDEGLQVCCDIIVLAHISDINDKAGRDG